MGTLSDATDLGIDVLIDKFGGEVTAILQIVKLVISAVAGQNLSYERENLISADLSTQITVLASDKIQLICGQSKKLGDGKSYYVASGVENCVNVSQYMIYYVVTRQFGEVISYRRIHVTHGKKSRLIHQPNYTILNVRFHDNGDHECAVGIGRKLPEKVIASPCCIVYIFNDNVFVTGFDLRKKGDPQIAFELKE